MSEPELEIENESEQHDKLGKGGILVTARGVDSSHEFNDFKLDLTE